MRRTKRRLLREVVDENVRLIRNERVPPPRPRRGLSALSALSLTVAVLALAPLTVGVREPPAAAPATLPRAHPAPPLHRPATSPSEVRFARPAPLDPAALPLAVRRIVLDPGHGGAATGTRTPDGLLEKDLNLDLARRVRRLLEAASFEVLMTRDGDEDIPLEERARFANAARADLFISIHGNWIENRTIHGVETYYLGPTDDPYITQLAASENRGSGLSLADLRPLLDEIYLDVRSRSSRGLAVDVQRSLLHSLREVSPDLEDRGVKTAPFIVLAETEMPAILAEVSCLSNQHEADLLNRPLYRQHIAEALAAGIRSYAVALAQEGPRL